MRKPVLLFVCLTFVNVGIFFFRSHFQYVKYSSYNELYSPCNANCESKWKKHLAAYDASELDEAKKILAPYRLDTATTISKILIIGKHLFNRLHKLSAIPSLKVEASTPLQQYKILSADKTENLWCSNYAGIFSFFCWSQNIVCRNVEIMQPGNHHVVSECFIPEKKEWAIVDIPNGILLATQNNKLMNVPSLVQAMSTVQPIETVTIKDGNYSSAVLDKQTPDYDYYRNVQPLYYYNEVILDNVYSRGEKLKRYILPHYWYEVYSNKKGNGILFYLKVGLLLAWLVSLLLLVFKFINYDRSKRHPQRL
jgi:hypothetical protein